jgi:hypothetical protein
MTYAPLSKRQMLAWSQKGFKEGYLGHAYTSAHAKEFGGPQAELSYAAGYRVGKRERFKVKKAVA